MRPRARRRTVRQPINTGQALLGYVELSGSIDYGQQTLATARRAFILAGIGATLLALVVGLWVSRSLSAPLTSLAAAAGEMSAGDLSVRAPVQGSDEIGQLGRQFNQMAERLEASFAELAAERDSLRRFIADASHELRTPITALRSFNELMQGPAAEDDGRTRRVPGRERRPDPAAGVDHRQPAGPVAAGRRLNRAGPAQAGRG